VFVGILGAGRGDHLWYLIQIGGIKVFMVLETLEPVWGFPDRFTYTVHTIASTQLTGQSGRSRPKTFLTRLVSTVPCSPRQIGKAREIDGQCGINMAGTADAELRCVALRHDEVLVSVPRTTKAMFKNIIELVSLEREAIGNWLLAHDCWQIV
jgi:hypothetical protein